MKGEWLQVKLGDHVTHQKGFAFKSKEYRDRGYPVVRVSNFTDRSIDTGDLKYLMNTEVSQYRDYELKVNDVVIATVGSWPTNPASVVGKAIRVPAMADGALLNQNAVRLRANSQLDQIFLFNLLKTGDYQNYIVSTAQGSANQASITLKAIFDFEFLLPSIDEQKSIAHILGTLDDKIELNRQMNATLEAMAQTLFKSWFVDFDPVIENALAAGNPIPKPLQARAEMRKALGDQRKPLPEAIQNQFPNSFVFTEEMGWVPEGWQIMEAQEIASISIGKTPPRKEAYWFSSQQYGNVVWVSIRDMGNSGVFIGDSSEYLTPDSISKFNVKVIPKESVILSFKLTLGRVAIAQTELATNEAIAHFVSPKFGLTKEFIFSYLKNFDYGSLGSTSSIATAVNSKLIKAMPFVVPTQDLLVNYQEASNGWFKKMSSISNQITTLSKLRDALLPKLLSGQLRIPDAEKQLAEAI